MRDLDLFISNNKVIPHVSGNTIDGLELLAQRVIVVLNTRISEPLRDAEGCSFMSLFGSSQADISYIYLMLSSVIPEILNAMDDPEDEYGDYSVHSIDISGVTVDNDTITFNLTVTSKSGSTYTTEASLGGSL